MTEKIIVALDSQKLSMAQLCECKYDYVFNKEWVPPENPEGMEKGSLIHEGLDYHHNRLRLGLPIDIPGAVAAMEAKSINMTLPHELVELSIEVFKDYVEFWGRDSAYEFLKVEQTGSKVLYEDGNLVILYETKIDTITKLRSQGIILPWDTKTYSRKSPIIPLNNQFIGYCWMLGCSNILINRIGFQKTLKPKEKFIREIMSYPAQIIEQWRTNAIDWVIRILKDQERGYWPQNYTSCDKFNKECAYTTLCRAPEETRQHKAMALFNIGQGKWDVGAKL